MPILFDNATRNVTLGGSPRKRIGHDVIELKKKLLTRTVRDLYKRRDESRKQSLIVPSDKVKISKSLSTTKHQSQFSRTQLFATPSKCKIIHPAPQSSEKQIGRASCR